VLISKSVSDGWGRAYNADESVIRRTLAGADGDERKRFKAAIMRQKQQNAKEVSISHRTQTSLSCSATTECVQKVSVVFEFG
jgi:hypothetical protein